MSIDVSQIDLLSKMMDLAADRHRVISSNIANVNTPGYHAARLSFDQRLEELLEPPSTDALTQLAEGSSETVYDLQTPARADGNNVDIDREIGALNKNELMYQTYTQILASKLGMMRSAITGRS